MRHPEIHTGNLSKDTQWVTMKKMERFPALLHPCWSRKRNAGTKYYD